MRPCTHCRRGLPQISTFQGQHANAQSHVAPRLSPARSLSMNHGQPGEPKCRNCVVNLQMAPTRQRCAEVAPGNCLCKFVESLQAATLQILHRSPGPRVPGQQLFESVGMEPGIEKSPQSTLPARHMLAKSVRGSAKSSSVVPDSTTCPAASTAMRSQRTMLCSWCAISRTVAPRSTLPCSTSAAALPETCAVTSSRQTMRLPRRTARAKLSS